MQVTGTFPELSAGRTKSKPKAKAESNCGVGGFAIKGRVPKNANNPKSFAGRRAASHAKAYKD